MKPAPYKWATADGVDSAAALLAEFGDDAKLIAGGQSLVPLLALRMAQPAVLVDIDRVEDLDHITERNGDTYFGALVRHRRLVEDPSVAAVAPLLPVVAEHIGHEAIRNRGTLGGSLAHADPAAELPAVMVLLDAGLVCFSQRSGRREVAAHQFFSGPYSTSLKDDEVLVAARIPRRSRGTTFGFSEHAPRDGDFARAGTVCSLTVGTDGVLQEVRVVVFAACPSPFDASRAVRVLRGATVAEARAELGDVSHEVARAIPETGMDSPYGRRLVATCTARALDAAFSRALR